MDEHEVEPSKKGFQYIRNYEFYSKMLDLDPGRHRIIENDWQKETTIA